MQNSLIIRSFFFIFLLTGNSLIGLPVNKLDSISDISLNSSGYFANESEALKFLKKSYDAQILPDPNFRDVGCMEGKDIMSAKGFQTLQLFMITSRCTGQENKYILKEIKSGMAEIDRLNKAVATPGLAPYIFPSEVPGFPTYYFPSSYIVYRHKLSNHYMTTIPVAKGVLLTKTAGLFRSGQLDRGALRDMYFEAGKAVSNFHRAFMKPAASSAKHVLQDTMIHGDFHQDNVFFDPDAKKLRVIDNERISASNYAHPYNDLSYFFFHTVTAFLPSDIKADKAFMRDWLYETLKSFVKGYVLVFDPSVKGRVVQELKEKFRDDLFGVGTFLKKVFTFDYSTIRVANKEYWPEIERALDDVSREL